MKTSDFVVTLFDGQNNPNKVTVAFAMALNALKKGHSTIIILMVDAVALGKPDATAGIDIGHPFEPVADLCKAYLEQGGRIAVCGPCMIHNGFSADDMVKTYEIIKAPDVVDLLMAAKGSLQIT